MINPQFPYRLYLVTDEAACLGRDFFGVIEDAVKGGVDVVQLREKTLVKEAFLEKALRLKTILDRYHVPLIINDNVWVASQCQAAGLHVGNSDAQPEMIRRQHPTIKILGYSIEHESQLQSENAALSDYLALSPIFSTPTKTDTITEWKLEGIARIRKLTQKPLVAIGAINEANAAAVIAAGADCLAVVSAVCAAKNPALAAERLRNQIEKAIAHQHEKI
ncbi:MAG: thiamine phosphate synthase [Janthinobacterium lividum]